ncbi:hypothetical protein [Rhodococcus pyridinivorans]|uniref:hypothetical protein n=1 Tax=Rhodococcus pyridinivorans TaxID=103816 RepID=UPI002659B670|nr:hypothetical protein [Rhodococcus pyridinivorans]
MRWDARKAGQLAVTIAVVLGGVTGAVLLAQPADDPGVSRTEPPSSTAQPALSADPSDPVLTMQIAQHVWDESESARERQDAAGYEASTCARYIEEERQRRGAETTADLLAAFAEAEQFRPPWTIEEVSLLLTEQTGSAGLLRVEATVTDYRSVPATTERRELDYRMSSTEGRWKVCPSTNPIG